MMTKNGFQAFDFPCISSLSKNENQRGTLAMNQGTGIKGQNTNLSACSMCFYNTDGGRINVTFFKQLLEQIDLRFAMRMCDRMGIATLIDHDVPNNSVYSIVFRNSIREALEDK
jgi:hypothetical protein